MPKLDILAIAAHPDDVEITCGGLMIKMSHLGRKTGVLDLARGEMGSYGDENDRDIEANAAAKIMGLSFRENLGLPDSAIQYNHENKLQIVEIIRKTRPELVILPHWDQRHPDHLACCKLGYDACFLSGLSKIPVTGEPHRPRKIIYASYHRNYVNSFVVDISDYFGQKLDAVAAYKSQFGDDKRLSGDCFEKVTLGELSEDDAAGIFSPGVGILDLMYTRAHMLGQKAGVKFAEGYMVKENILIDDPQSMPIQSL